MSQSAQMARELYGLLLCVGFAFSVLIVFFALRVAPVMAAQAVMTKLTEENPKENRPTE